MPLDKATKRKVITSAIILGIAAVSIAVFCIDTPEAVMAFDKEPVANWASKQPTVDAPELVGADMAWMLVSSALVLLMTPGLAFFYGGMVRSKNVISTLLQSYFTMGVVSLLWVFVGFSMAFGESLGGFIGNPATYFFFNNVGADPNPALTPTIPLALYALFQLKFAIITPALISGALAERIHFTSYVIFFSLWSIVVYCPMAHMVWHPQGLIRNFETLDFAGGTVVHMASGYAAMVGSWMLGHRTDRPQKMQPANIPFVMLGTAMLWFGWFGFNAGSALSASPLAVQAFLTTNTASAAAMVTWVFCDHIRGSKSTAMGACVGAVVGLVVITPAAGFVTVGASLLMGMIGAIICNVVAHEWFERTSVDDTLDVWPCHGLGGTIGMLLTSLFATKEVNPAGFDGAFYGNPQLFYHHLAVLVCIVPFIMIMSYICYKIADLIYPLRVSPKSEKIGLDVTQHNECLASSSEALGLDATGHGEFGSSRGDEYKAQDIEARGVEMTAH